MINDRPPRDVRPPSEPRDVTGNDITRGVHVADRSEDAMGNDFLGESLSQFPPPAPQHGYPFINTSRSGPSSSYEETVAEPVQFSGPAFHELLHPFHDHHALYPGPRSALHEGWEETSDLSITGLPSAPIMSSHVAPRMRYLNDSDAYSPPGEVSDPAQLHLDSPTFLLPSQGDIPATSALDVLSPATFDNNPVPPVAYYHSGRVNYDDHESSTLPTSIPRSLNSYGASEDPSAEFAFSHAAPHRQSGLSRQGGLLISRVHPFESEQPLATGVQDESPHGTSFFSCSPGGGPSRHSAVGSPLPNPLLNSLPVELFPRYKQYDSNPISLGSGTSAQSDAGPSRSRHITSDGPPGSVSYLSNGKRKRSSDEKEGIIKGLPRQRGNSTLQSNTQNRLVPPPTGWTKIEQTPYVCGSSQHNWVPQSPIYFTVNGQPGIRLTDALDPQFPGPDGRDDPMFQYASAGSSVSCRINFPRHPAQSSQITTADHKKVRNPRTRRKLAFEVAKRIKRYVEKFQVGMRCESMILTKLDHLSKASWQPEIWYE